MRTRVVVADPHLVKPIARRWCSPTANDQESQTGIPPVTRLDSPAHPLRSARGGRDIVCRVAKSLLVTGCTASRARGAEE